MKTLWRRVDQKGPKDPYLEILAALGCKSFSFETLSSATHNFRPENKFHEDGFVSMYKGMLKDGTQIAVEKPNPRERDQRKESEIQWLSRLHHPNVVKFYGYCAHNNQLLFVYKYYPDCLGELLNTSKGRKQLNWRRRYKIMEGIASGLNYLHSGSQNGSILHHNIKLENICLDQEWNPLIGGFSLGRQLFEDQTIFTDRIVGTSEFMAPESVAPEYMTKGCASVKTDVYSFGITMLELISGIKVEDFRREENVSLLLWAHELFKRGKVSEIADPVLVDLVIRKQVENCVKISLLCTQLNPNSRPRMEDVVSMLAGKCGYTETPIFCHNDEFEEAVHAGEEFSYDNSSWEHSNTFTVHAQDDHGPQHENFEKKITAQNCQKFSYETLYDATNKFASQNELGRGGFGLVYKGKLDNGREIAVKKPLLMSEILRKALEKEVDLLCRVKHPNVVKLVGYCIDNNELLLVSEYVPNESLDKLLFGPNRREDLNWLRTYGIIVGIAKGLSYLHGDPQNCIIHRDIKAGNILIDHKWVPKIVDFGISRLLDEDQTHVYTDAIGTRGYIAPEYLDCGHVSVKTDVYSFGVLLLELISGKKFSFKLPHEDHPISLLDWAYKLFKTGRILEIMDRALIDSAMVEQVKNCIIIGLLCTQGDPKLRPDMESVIFMLTGQQDWREMLILRPGIYGYRGYHSDLLNQS